MVDHAKKKERVQEMATAYQSGRSLKEIGNEFGMSPPWVYHILKDAGCKFRKRTDYPTHFSEEERKRRADRMSGKHLSKETRKRISDRLTVGYNGMNGYGHIKPHPKGYILAYAPQHPSAHKDGYVMLHTVVMERSIGRYLNNNEVVHHINHKRDDNRIENLQLMDKKEHINLHLRERRDRTLTQ